MPMNWLDAALAAFAAAAAYGGFRLGFVTRSVSWAGLVLGAMGGMWVVPAVLRAIRGESTPDQLFFASLTLLLAASMLGQALGLLAGSRLSHSIHSSVGRRIDQLGGGLAGLVGVAALVWLLSPAMAMVQGSTSGLARGSLIVRRLDSFLPPPPDTTRTLRHLVGGGSPQVFSALQRTAGAGEVPATSGMGSDATTRVTASTVRVVGQACALIQEGSGYVAAPDTIVTNAHVVAGESATTVDLPGGGSRRASVVAFDPDRDVAVLHVDGLGLMPLRSSPASVGTRGAVFGHPGGGPLEISPAQVGEEVTAVGSDIYDHHTTRRDVLVLAAHLAPGDSGAAFVDQAGTVRGLAFAIAPDRSGVAYALQTNEVDAVLGSAGTTPVATGACAG